MGIGTMVILANRGLISSLLMRTPRRSTQEFVEGTILEHPSAVM
uniref:Uncharacterized protein n=1 Tax=Phlebotomus papatasi TaxID=29031 RepID=A0A1B0GNH0_PHLPP